MDMENIFERMDLRQICSFLLDGVGSVGLENGTYRERLSNGNNSIYKRLEQLYQDGDELDKAVADLSEALTTYEAVYTEIGMKFGARIVFQLLNINDPMQFKESKNNL